jgi:glycosyltransferase involved in cell wall biosynthesis
VNVLLVSQYFWPESFRINEVATSLRDAGCAVTVLTGQPNYPEGVIPSGYSMLSVRVDEYQGLCVYRVPLVPRGRGSGFRLALNYLSFVFFASVVGPWLLRGRQVDVVLVHGMSPILQSIPGIWLARFKKAKVVTWVQDLWPESLAVTGFVRNPRLLRAVRHVVRWIYRHNDLLLVQSRAFIAPVRRLAARTPVEYHPNPGELAFGGPARVQTAELRLPPGFNVVFAGNLGTVQSLGTIVEAAELLRDMPDVRFVLVGSGSRDEWLAGEVQRRQLQNVQLAGRFPSSAMPGILAQASALLVTLARSPIMAQTIPSKVQAYLAAGKPILAALDGEGADVVRDANAGIASAAEDARGLANAVRRLRAMSEGERTAMGVAGREYYDRNFDPAFLARQLRVVLERVVNVEPVPADASTDDEVRDCGK